MFKVNFYILTKIHDIIGHSKILNFLSVQLIKRGAIIESDKKFHNQIRIISLADSSPYETLHSFVSNTVAPYFKSYVKRGGEKAASIADPSSSSINRLLPSGSNLLDGTLSGVGSSSGSNAENASSSSLSGVGSGGSGGGNDQFVSNIEKKIAEVELGLLNLQQNIDIPEIDLAIHPYIYQIIKRCVEENRKPKADDLQDKLDDANFLNNLQSGVSKWIREIKSVTKLNRDPSTGTALQEISFWLSLERALNRIQEKRESVEVHLTLETLRYGKRFIATTSFDSDTGLKEALDTAKDYNVLMKDFPLSELLSATELSKITLAIQNIFQHINKKIKVTKYPLHRLLKLIEAISKDLSTQLLKVLSTQRLMLVGFDEFEKTIKACLTVFGAWVSHCLSRN
jgi:dynein heavy chain 1